MTNPLIDQYAVFGNPIEQSRSPQIHSQFAKQTGEVLHYSRQRVELGGFVDSASAFFDAGGLGLNVTAPFKLEAFQFADELTDRAQHAGAVNTLILRDSIIIGDNTDGVGLVRDLTSNLIWPLEDRRMLLIGAGGAARGVIAPILDERPSSLMIVNRTASKAEALAALFSADAALNNSLIVAGGFELLLEESGHYDVIINASSTGFSGELPPVPDAIFSDTFCYDMMYAKASTAFLLRANQLNSKGTADGLGMLVEQAAESFYLWRGKQPKTRALIDSLRQEL